VRRKVPNPRREKAFGASVRKGKGKRVRLERIVERVRKVLYEQEEEV